MVCRGGNGRRRFEYWRGPTRKSLGGQRGCWVGFGGSCSRRAGWVVLTVQDLRVGIVSSRQNRESDLAPRAVRVGGGSPCDSWNCLAVK